jgi:hypothetical protein
MTAVIAIIAGIIGMMLGGSLGLVVGAALGARRREELEGTLAWYERMQAIEPATEASTEYEQAPGPVDQAPEAASDLRPR